MRHCPLLRLLSPLLVASACVLVPPLPAGPDGDSDGVVDADDFCPTVAGTRAASGCTDAQAVEDERSLRLLQASELERSREALQALRAEAARAAEEAAEEQARLEEEERRWAEESARYAAEARAAEERRAREEASLLASMKSDEERAAWKAAMEEAEAAANAKDDEERARIRAQLEAARSAGQRSKSSPSDWVKDGRLTCAPGDPLCADLSPEPPPPPPDPTTKSFDFEGDTIQGDLVKPDGEFLEARQASQNKLVPRYAYPTLEVPPFVKPRQPFDLRVTLTDLLRSTATRVDEGSTDAEGRLALELPADAGQWTIDLEVSAPGFHVVGDATGTLVLQPTGDSTTAKFRLVPLDLPKPAPERRVFVSLWFEGNFLARVSRTIAVRETAPPATVAKEPEAPARTAPPETPPAIAETAALPSARTAKPTVADTDDGGFSFETGEADADGGAAFVAGRPTTGAKFIAQKLGRPAGEPLIDRRRQAADLTLHLVVDEAVPGRWSLYVANAHGFVPNRTDVVAPADFDAWLAAEFKRFSGTLSRGARRRDAPAPAAAIAELKGFGRRLWSTHVPRAVQNLFWILHDTLGDEFRAIQVYTNVPSFPWELAKPWRRKADGSVEELEFLGIRYRVARWHVGRDDAEQLARPPQRQPLEAVTAVVPRYEGADDLPAVKREVAAISHIPLSNVMGGSRAELVKALDSAPRGIVHFAGHGVAISAAGASPSWAVKLEKDDVLQVREWRGLTSLTSPPRLFFVNACELGQSERVAGLVDGWAPALLDTGASAYIGGLWPLGDTGASEFARRFYVAVDEAVDAGEPVRIADLLSAARKGLYEFDDATFLGYVFYGDANLLLEP